MTHSLKGSTYELGVNFIRFGDFEYLIQALENNKEGFSSQLIDKIELTDSSVVILNYALLHEETNRRFLVDMLWDKRDGYNLDVMEYQEITKER